MTRPVRLPLPWPIFIVTAAVLSLASCTRPSTASSGDKQPVEPPAGGQAAAAKDRILLPREAQRRGGLEAVLVRARVQPETVAANGVFALNEDTTWRVGSYFPGRVAEVDAKVGEVVSRGSILARLHSHDVHNARAAYRQALADLAGAESQRALARQYANRAHRLFRLQAISESQQEQADADLGKAQAMSESAKAAVERERVHLTEVLQVPIAADPRDERTEMVSVTSPARGVVMERLVSAGTVVNPGSPMFTVADISSLWLIVSVNEGDLSKVKPGQTVEVRVRAYPERSFLGKTTWLGESLDPATRTVQVRVVVPNPGGLLKPQMFATAAFRTASGTRPVISIPQSAVQDLNGQSVVFLQTGPESFEPRVVVQGVTRDGQAEIREGLRDGDRVVAKGSYGLKSELLKSSLQGGE